MEPEDQAWRRANRANWDERVPIHLKAYDLESLRAGNGQLHPIEEAELGPVDGLRVLHLQCHFGKDTLILAQRGADATGLDFSPPAIRAAQELAVELGLESRSRFVEADLYDAPAAIGEAETFDRVFVTWGAINWLPDIRRWAKIVAQFLKPGGALYLAEGHPAALVFDSEVKLPDGMPGWYVPYCETSAFIDTCPLDYADDTARLQNARTYEWVHGLGEVATALLDAGLTLRWLHEHAAVPWRMFDLLVKGEDGMYRWPDRPWMPLAFSLWAERPGG